MKFSDHFAGISMLAAGPLDPDFQGPRAGRNARLHDVILQTVCDGDLEYFQELPPWKIAETERSAITSSGVKIRQVVGQKDSSLADNRKFHEHLDELKLPHEFVVLPDISHDTRDVLTALWKRDGAFYADVFRHDASPEK